MKDSKDYGPKVIKLYSAIKRGGDKPEMPHYSDPIEAIVYALISENMTETVSARTFKRVKSHFVDLNDLRVSRIEEILDVFKDSSKEAEDAAKSVNRILNNIFEKTDRVNLDSLQHEGKRQAHKQLTEIENITPFAVSYCFLTSLGGHAIPLTKGMIDYLRANSLVHPEADPAEIAGFLERQIAAADAYTFYYLLRKEAEQGASAADTGKPKAEKKKAAPKKTAKASAKPAKKAAKKKTQ